MLAFSHFKQKNLSRRRLSLCVNQCPLVSCTRKPGRHAFRYYIESKVKFQTELQLSSGIRCTRDGSKIWSIVVRDRNCPHRGVRGIEHFKAKFQTHLLFDRELSEDREIQTLRPVRAK